MRTWTRIIGVVLVVGLLFGCAMTKALIKPKVPETFDEALAMCRATALDNEDGFKAKGYPNIEEQYICWIMFVDGLFGVDWEAYMINWRAKQGMIVTGNIDGTWDAVIMVDVQFVDQGEGWGYSHETYAEMKPLPESEIPGLKEAMKDDMIQMALSELSGVEAARSVKPFLFDGASI